MKAKTIIATGGVGLTRSSEMWHISLLKGDGHGNAEKEADWSVTELHTPAYSSILKSFYSLNGNWCVSERELAGYSTSESCLCPIFQARAGPANIQNPVFINYTLTNRVHLTSTETSYQ